MGCVLIAIAWAACGVIQYFIARNFLTRHEIWTPRTEKMHSRAVIIGPIGLIALLGCIPKFEMWKEKNKC